MDKEKLGDMGKEAVRRVFGPKDDQSQLAGGFCILFIHVSQVVIDLGRGVELPISKETIAHEIFYSRGHSSQDHPERARKLARDAWKSKERLLVSDRTGAAVLTAIEGHSGAVVISLSSNQGRVSAEEDIRLLALELPILLREQERKHRHKKVT